MRSGGSSPPEIAGEAQDGGRPGASSACPVRRDKGERTGAARGVIAEERSIAETGVAEGRGQPGAMSTSIDMPDRRPAIQMIRRRIDELLA